MCIVPSTDAAFKTDKNHSCNACSTLAEGQTGPDSNKKVC